ncbi:MAG: CsbD family protein [Acidobacteria bacterium]|nr:MAG: CsbD family protein [Acidobacteriota bacterium]
MRYEDELKGKGKQVKGAAKEKLGKLAGDPNLQQIWAEESPANGDAGDSFFLFPFRERKRR